MVIQKASVMAAKEASSRSKLYQGSFDPKRCGNWQQVKDPVHPKARMGYTQFIVNERGHLLPEVPRSAIRPCNWHVKTWDLPCTIPGLITSTVNMSPESIQVAKEKRIKWENDLKRIWLADRKGLRWKRFYKGTDLEKKLVKLDMPGVIAQPDDVTFFWELPNSFGKLRKLYLPTPSAPCLVFDRPLPEQEPKKPKLKTSELCYHSSGIAHPKKYPCYRNVDETAAAPTYNCLARICPIAKKPQQPCMGS